MPQPKQPQPKTVILADKIYSDKFFHEILTEK